jgi:hypothetical protein
MNKFRNLKADEIEVRIQSVKSTGIILLLYKDARCDMNILDETVGAMNWQRKHLRDNKNCIVSIWDEDKKIWVEKEDTGTESNTEMAKGLASDSFKRACFNWGIGRELYTSPFIWIGSEWATIKNVNGKDVCYDKFEVEKIETLEGKITKIAIINSKTKTRVFVQK